MDLAEFKRKNEEIETIYKNGINELLKQYAKENNKVKIGDIIEDSIGKIKVRRISYARGYINKNPAYAMYHGVVLNKNGTDNKKGKERVISQMYLLEKS